LSESEVEFGVAPKSQMKKIISMITRNPLLGEKHAGACGFTQRYDREEII
jgi:hypothetical protein